MARQARNRSQPSESSCAPRARSEGATETGHNAASAGSERFVDRQEASGKERRRRRGEKENNSAADLAHSRLNGNAGRPAAEKSGAGTAKIDNRRRDSRSSAGRNRSAGPKRHSHQTAHHREATGGRARFKTAPAHRRADELQHFCERQSDG